MIAEYAVEAPSHGGPLRLPSTDSGHGGAAVRDGKKQA